MRILLKLQFTKKEKAALSIVSGFYSNAVLFAISINNMNKTKQNFLHKIETFFVIVAKPSVLFDSFIVLNLFLT